MPLHTTRWTLIDAAKRGDERALEALLERYRAPILGYLRSCGLTAADAEDVAQEVFLRLYQRVLPSAEATRGRFRSLLLKVTQNAFLDRARRLQAQKRGGGQAPLSLEEAQLPALQPHDVFDREWLGNLLARSLSRLEREHPHYYAALDAVHLQRLSYADAAARLEVSETAVRNHAHRGKQKVHAYLRAEVRHYAADRSEHETEITLLQRLLGE
ncbi:MAG: RNA polymerase sigma factor [Planctomycetota bacterium]